MYLQFIRCGYSPLLFEELSPAEIIDMLDGYSWKKNQDEISYRNKIRDFVNVLDGFSNAFLENLGNQFSGNAVEYKKLSSFFPNLFQEGNTPAKDELSEEMKLYKAQRKHHAYRVNAARHSRGEG